MPGHTRAPLALGGAIALAIGAAVWVASSRVGVEPARQDTDGSPGGAPDASTPATSSSSRARTGTAAVFGEVRSSAGHAPVAGQEVVLTAERGDPRRVATDAAGAFRFEKLPHGGPYELTAAAPGCGTIRIPGIALDRNEKRNLGTLFLDPAVRVLVRVRTLSDAPVAGALVEAYVIPAEEDDWSRMCAQLAQVPIAAARATSDAKGEAVFAETAVGEWRFTASKDGFAKGGTRVSTLATGPEGRTATVHLVSGHGLEGRVTRPDGSPAGGALVTAGDADRRWNLDQVPLHARTRTDAEGRYAFRALPAGDVQLWVRAGGGPPLPVARVRVPLLSHCDVVLPATGFLAGRVTTQEEGVPLEGATVRATGDTSEVAFEAVSDAEGRYRVEMATGPVGGLTVEKSGFVQVVDETSAAASHFGVVPEGSDLVRNLVMRPGARLVGTVRSMEGPLAGARVTAHFPAPGHEVGERTATTDADGTFAFPDMPACTALLTAEKDGWFQADVPEDPWVASKTLDACKELKVVVHETGEAVKDVEMRRGSRVEGRVETADGAPLAGARVSGWRALPAEPTGADGAFRLEGVRPGAGVELGCEKEGFVLARSKPVTVAEDAPTTGVVLRMLRRARVRGTVTAASGGELREACVLLASRGPEEGDEPSRTRWRWVSAERVPVRPDGTWDATVPCGPPQCLLVRAVAIGRAPADAEPIAVTEEQDAYEVALVLRDGAELAGRVTARDGSGVPDAEVALAEHGHDEHDRNASTVCARTDSTGAFAVRPLASGRYDVSVGARGHVTARVVADTATGSLLVVELAPELTIEGIVALADGAAIEGVQVEARTATEGSSGSSGSNSRATPVVTDASGRFRVSGLVEGRYRIAALSQDSRVNVRPRSVDGVTAGTKDLRIVLDAGGTIRGRVVDFKGRPVAGAWISASTSEQEGGEPPEDENLWADTHQDGTFTLTGLGPGPYDLDVSEAQGLQDRSVAAVAVGTKELEVVLEEGLSIAGQLVDPDGRPLVTVSVDASPVEGGHGSWSNVYTDAQGRFTIRGLPPGAYRVVVSGWGDARQNWIVDPKLQVPAGTSGVRFTATRGETIAGVVVGHDGKPAAGAAVVVVITKAGERTSRQAKTRADGRFEVIQLVPGVACDVEARFQDCVPCAVKEVAPGTRDLRLVLSRGLKSTGRLLDAAGAPLQLVEMRLARSGERARSMTTDAQGRFTVTGLAEGSYEVSTLQPKTADDSEPTWTPCGTLTAGDTDVELRVPK